MQYTYTYTTVGFGAGFLWHQMVTKLLLGKLDWSSADLVYMKFCEIGTQTFVFSALSGGNSVGYNYHRRMSL